MSTHKAVGVSAQGGQLVEIQVPTAAIQPGKVLVKVHYAAPGPLDVWQWKFGLLVQTWPLIPCDSVVGTVSAVGEGVSHLKVGDKVVSFTFGFTDENRGAQQYVLIPANRVGKVPANVDDVAATTIPNNLVTAVHSLVDDLQLPLVLDASDNPVDEATKNKRILVWGGSSSVGQYAIQLLALAGYHHIITTASARHHDYLKKLGATKTVDYTSANYKEEIGEVDLVLDCIGDDSESLKKIAQVVKKEAKSKIAALLPIRTGGRSASGVLWEPSAGVIPEHVQYVGVRTHFYEQNERMAKDLQSTIIPELLKSGKIVPNRARLISEGSPVKSYQKALEELSAGNVSCEKLVVKIDWN